MPALPSVPGVVAVKLIYTLNEDVDVMNRLFFEYSGAAPTNAQMNTFCAAVAAAWNTDMAARHSAGLALTGVLSEDLTSPISAVGLWTGSHAGTDATSELSAGAALVIRNHIARRYRGGHCRTYLPGFTSANLHDAQTWDTSHLAGTLTAWSTFIAAIDAAAWFSGSLSQVNVSYYEGFTNFTYPSGRTRAIPTLRTTPLVDVIASLSANPKVCSQRRRNLSRS